MAQPPARSKPMPFLDASLKLYRKTLKRYKPAHLAMHRLMDELVLPALERRQDFQDHRRRSLLVSAGACSPGGTKLRRRHACGGWRSRAWQRWISARHIGYFTRLLSQLTGADGQVIAFEPHPRTGATLRRNTRDLPNTRVMQAAVADSNGSAELHDYLMMSASGSLSLDESLARQQRGQMGAGDFTPRSQPGFEARSYTVDTVSIDACLGALGIQTIDLIKMDIEGAELSALRGMKKTIANSPDLALVMEYNPAALMAFGHAPEAALHEALGLGFRSNACDRSRWRAARLDA